MQARPGAIILPHDIYAPTVEAVPALTESLQRRGLHFVTVSELLELGGYPSSPPPFPRTSPGTCDGRVPGEPHVARVPMTELPPAAPSAPPPAPAAALPPAPGSAVAGPEPRGRLMSVDALRGFTMFWIVGADELVEALHNIHDRGFLRNLARQLEHKSWEGFSFYDLIFPLFLFIVGFSITLSLPRLVAREGRGGAVQHILARSAILFALGIFYNGGLLKPLEDIRYVGVLQRTALCYAAAGLLCLGLRPRGLVGVVVAILLGYWALLAWVPVPGYGPPTLEQGSNLVDWLDLHYLPGGLYQPDHDPEGLLSTLPAVVSCLVGVLAGFALLAPTATPDLRRRLRNLALAGAAMVGLGFLWHLRFPIIKELWTSSFVLVAGGYSCLLLAFFGWQMDVRGRRRWAQPFVWLGLNPIFIYLVTNVVSFHTLAERLVGGDLNDILDERIIDGAGDLLVSLVGLAMVVALAYGMHRRKVYLKV